MALLGLAPGAAERGFVAGANHHLGDASFVARFGRPPGRDDPEALRMHTHLVHVRRQLGARPATRPELAPRRAAILAHLDAYIAKGTTPVNLHLPWRSPVFVDDFGNVCAVGALIAATHPDGMALVHRVAATHATSPSLLRRCPRRLSLRAAIIAVSTTTTTTTTIRPRRVES